MKKFFVIIMIISLLFGREENLPNYSSKVTSGFTYDYTDKRGCRGRMYVRTVKIGHISFVRHFNNGHVNYGKCLSVGKTFRLQEGDTEILKNLSISGQPDDLRLRAKEVLLYSSRYSPAIETVEKFKKEVRRYQLTE